MRRERERRFLGIFHFFSDVCTRRTLPFPSSLSSSPSPPATEAPTTRMDPSIAATFEAARSDVSRMMQSLSKIGARCIKDVDLLKIEFAEVNQQSRKLLSQMEKLRELSERRDSQLEVCTQPSHSLLFAPFFAELKKKKKKKARRTDLGQVEAQESSNGQQF